MPIQYKNVGYDPIEDFTPIARIGAAVTLLVARPALGIKSAADLPQAITTRMTTEIRAILDDTTMAKKLDSMDIVVNWADGKTFLAGMKTDTARWAALVKSSGVTFE